MAVTSLSLSWIECECTITIKIQHYHFQKYMVCILIFLNTYFISIEILDISNKYWLIVSALPYARSLVVFFLDIF